ncbi:ATP-binding protein [Methylibium sp.]|uniref:sensor histidine kinase n=1 Tax=Methylibium sp. TaxID=2067992 RepID=UPI003D12A6D2
MEFKRLRRRLALLVARHPDRRVSRGVWIVSLAATIAAALVLTFLLAIATNNREFYERHYTWLLWVNVVIATLLVGVIGVGAVRLVARVLRGRFGSRLLLRLAAIFGVVAVLPGALVYTVSYQFVSRSIESWFDVRVEGALEAGLNLGRGTLDALVNDFAGKTRVAAERLGEAPERQQPLALERLREQLTAQDVAVLGANGQVLSSAGAAAVLAPERPSLAQLRQARAARVTTQIDGLDDDGAATRTPGAPGADLPPQQPRVRVIALVPAEGFSLSREDRYLVVSQLLPATLAANALAVQSAYREYQQRSLAREGLRKMYIGTLTLTLILAVFGAMLLAVTFANRLARPLLLLADGVREVARGDLSPKPVFASGDELGGLTRSFADMTQQLADARGLVEQSVAELETARGKLQAILDNMSAGVIVFDRDRRIDSVNAGATRILRAPLSAYLGRALGDVPGLEGFDAALRRRFDQIENGSEQGDRDHWQDSFELTTTPDREAVTLLLRGAPLPSGGLAGGAARLVVFDDITELVSAQRAEAWGEVARRLAHEIKNPLTPIQLSAERIQHRLEAKLDAPDQQMLAKSVATIVNQVQAMKQLVNEFRDYARLPAAQLAPLDLNALVLEVLGLYAEVQESGRLRTELAEGLPRIQGDATQLRQVVHNLVQNALDAVAERTDGQVRVRTEGARNEQGQWRAVRLVVADNGPGFGERMLKRAFEPYVTTKTKGTGLGLAVVKKIADEHGARVRLTNLAGEGPADAGVPTVGGAQVSLSFSKWLPGQG